VTSVQPMPSGSPGPDGRQAEEDSFTIDRQIHAWQSQFTGGLSPAALLEAFSDWGIHLANAPAKQADLARKACRKWIRFLHFAAQSALVPEAPPAISPLPGDRRFDGADWQRPPFSLLWQSFLLTQQWWHNATTGVRGVDPRHADIVRFTVRQILDAGCPANFPCTNPEVLRVTVQTAGDNLRRGWQNAAQDAFRLVAGRPGDPDPRFQPGRTVAVTPGKVVHRNRLIELIRYAPATPTVFAEPILIVPAWIMKYYILDLSPANSLVRYLVDRGHTVFMISWRNPDAGDRDLGMEDYLTLGPLAALQVIAKIMPDTAVHGVGYCLGGTLLAIAAAHLAALRRSPFRTLSMLAAQVDFSEAGELMLFINHSQVTWLEDMMWDRGYLDTTQMAGAFQLLRSNDLVWSRMIRQYLLGERPAPTDLTAWNADATRMPFRMHADYLRRLFLDNDLAEGRYSVRGKPVLLTDIEAPLFLVGTERDHIAPWRSVYKLTWLSQSEATFVLASGGHNVGIVSPPATTDDHTSRAGYRIGAVVRDDHHVDPDSWAAGARRHGGSWWPAWADWLAARSGERRTPPALATGPDAPGTYVLQR